MSAKRAQGFAVIISSPSGVGKTTVTKQILKNKKIKIINFMDNSYSKIKEKIKKTMFLQNKKSFFKNVKNKKFLEYAKVFNNYYGTPKKKFMTISKKVK